MRFLPLSIETISSSAFNDCSGLTDVYYAGTQAQAEDILIGTGNTYLSAATWHFLADEVHEWSDDVSYEWATDLRTVTASRPCKKHPGEKQSETVAVTATISQAATCEGKGFTTYVSNAFENPAFTVQSQTLEDINALGHDWGEPTWSWSDDHSNATATFTCQREGCACGEGGGVKVTTEMDNAPASVETPATCEEDGKTNYTASVAFNEQTYTKAVDVKTDDALGHLWSSVEYIWADDNSTVTATRTCQRQGCACSENGGAKVETETVNTTSQQTKNPSCEDAGMITYAATFENTAFSVAPKNVDIEALGHIWSEPTWHWSGDHSSATATFTCQREGCAFGENGGAKVVTETDNAPASTDTPATCEAVGKTTYTATVTFNEQEHSDALDIKTDDALGHLWSSVEYIWADDNSTVTATRACQRQGCACGENGGAKVEAETVNTTKQQTKDPSCEDTGTITYTATFMNTAFTVEPKNVDIEALGHIWSEPTYEWANDNSAVTAKRVCNRDGSHVETETVNTTASQTKAPTFNEKGETTYTATFNNTSFVTQTKVVDIPMLEKDNAVKSVEAAINALPGSVGLGDKATVEAARKAYDALTADQKKQISAYMLEKLTTAESQVKTAEEEARKAANDVAAVQGVIDAINALSANAGVGDKAAVEAARAAYNALTDDQKKLISAYVLADHRGESGENRGRGGQEAG